MGELVCMEWGCGWTVVGVVVFGVSVMDGRLVVRMGVAAMCWLG